MKPKRLVTIPIILCSLFLLMGAGDDSCDESKTAQAERTQREQQGALMQEATAQTGMPAIKNFRERKLLKDILELRDQDGLVTYTYTFSEMTGKYSFFCDSLGYGIPYATQYTSPERPSYSGSSNSVGYALPNADPNGLYSPSAAEGTWVMCQDPNGKRTRPIYVEPRVIVSPFKLP
jgi:hypothetical protein